MMRAPCSLSRRATAVMVAGAVALALGQPVQGQTLPDPPVPPPASFAPLAAAATAAVVSIRLTDGLREPPPESLDGTGLGDEPEAETSLRALLTRLLGLQAGGVIASGVVIDAAGTLLTSARIALAGAAFDVVTEDGSVVGAEILGIDARTDLAVLRLDPARRPFAHAPLGDSDRVGVGEWVIAVGAPHGLRASVTAGIVSAAARPLEPGPHAELVQVDAAIARGNAGGPVLDLQGRVVGIATGRVSAEGLGLAVPSNTARRVVADVREWGRVRRAWLGADGQALTPELAAAFRRADPRGVLLAGVAPGGPAAAAGLRPGDILLDVAARPLLDPGQLDRVVAAWPPGRTVRVGFWRAGRRAVAEVVLGEEPGPAATTPPLGLAVHELGPGLGLVVSRVDPEGPAWRAGVEPGDLVHEVDQQRVRTRREFEQVVRRPRNGAPLVLRLQRGTTAVYVALGPRS